MPTLGHSSEVYTTKYMLARMGHHTNFYITEWSCIVGECVKVDNPARKKHIFELFEWWFSIFGVKSGVARRSRMVSNLVKVCLFFSLGLFSKKWRKKGVECEKTSFGCFCQKSWSDFSIVCFLWLFNLPPLHKYELLLKTVLIYPHPMYCEVKINSMYFPQLLHANETQSIDLLFSSIPILFSLHLLHDTHSGTFHLYSQETTPINDIH